VQDQVADAVEVWLGAPPHLFVIQLAQAVLDATQGALQLVSRRSPNDSGQFVSSHAGSSTSPKARTGKVLRFLTLTGTDGPPQVVSGIRDAGRGLGLTPQFENPFDILQPAFTDGQATHPLVARRRLRPKEKARSSDSLPRAADRINELCRQSAA
jgi:hypothetical protein